MKLEDLKDVNKVVEILDRVNAAIDQAEAFALYVSDDGPDPGGIKGVFEYGYNGYFSAQRDGSGAAIDLQGCYVAGPVAIMIRKELIEQRERALTWLKEHGVEVNK